METGLPQYPALPIAECALQMTSVRRALAISFIERYALIVLSLASNILLARLLTPTEIGLYSVSLAAIGIAQVLRDFGIGTYLIQEKNLTDKSIGTAFGLSLFLGITLFGLCYFFAPIAGDIYNKPTITIILQICSLNFLILPFCTISLALHRRDMAFQIILYINIISTALGFLLTIMLTYHGCGANSMAWGSVLTNFSTAVISWKLRKNFSFIKPCLTEWRRVLNFGAQRSIASIVSSSATDASDLVAGKILGFSAVALLSKAQGLPNLFQRDLMSAVNSVALPAFAKSLREGDDLEKNLIYSIGIITVVSWPFYVICSLFSLELIRLLFGSQWDASSPLVALFCLGSAIYAPCLILNTFLIATGEITTATKAELTIHGVRATLIILGMIIFETISAPAISSVIVSTLALPYWYVTIRKVRTFSPKKLISTLARSAMCTAISITPSIVFVNFIKNNEQTSILEIITLGFISFPLWIFSLYAAGHELSKEALFVRLKEHLKRRCHL